MKKMIAVVLLLVSGNAFAQKIDGSKVPPAVIRSFKAKMVGSTATKWEKEKGNYEANYLQSNQERSATFTPDGKWLETENAITINELPAKAADYIAANYKGAKIKEAAKILSADGKVSYEAEVKGMDVIFDEQGKFIKTEKD